MRIPWQSSDWDSALSLLRARVQSLVGEIRSHKLHSAAKKTKKGRETWLQGLGFTDDGKAEKPSRTVRLATAGNHGHAQATGTERKHEAWGGEVTQSHPEEAGPTKEAQLLDTPHKSAQVGRNIPVSPFFPGLQSSTSASRWLNSTGRYGPRRLGNVACRAQAKPGRERGGTDLRANRPRTRKVF